jgi:hypothetical protein
MESPRRAPRTVWAGGAAPAVRVLDRRIAAAAGRGGVWPDRPRRRARRIAPAQDITAERGVRGGGVGAPRRPGVGPARRGALPGSRAHRAPAALAPSGPSRSSGAADSHEPRPGRRLTPRRDPRASGIRASRAWPSSVCDVCISRVARAPPKAAGVVGGRRLVTGQGSGDPVGPPSRVEPDPATPAPGSGPAAPPLVIPRRGRSRPAGFSIARRRRHGGPRERRRGERPRHRPRHCWMQIHPRTAPHRVSLRRRSARCNSGIRQRVSGRTVLDSTPRGLRGQTHDGRRARRRYRVLPARTRGVGPPRCGPRP